MAIAFPFVDVTIDTAGLLPVATRAPGVLAIVGASNAGTAAANDPVVIDDLEEAGTVFGAATDLGKALAIALLQDPAPSKIYGVKLNGTDWDDALAALEAADDVTFVALAGQPVSVGGAAGANNPIVELKNHCENQSAAGNKRIGVAAIDPALAKSDTYVTDVNNAATPLMSTSGRMVMVAARGATSGEVAAAAASAIAGQPPGTSMVLKKIRGFGMPLVSQYSPGEIKALSALGIIPIIDPALITGTSLHFAEGTTYSTDATLKYIDIVTLLDDIEFRLKANLIIPIGDARITVPGLGSIIRRADGVLDQVKGSGAIDAYTIVVPVYDALVKPEAARSPGEAKLIVDSRAERLVDMTVIIVIGTAVHHLHVALQPRF